MHVYLSTACQHETDDNNPSLHTSCRLTCKFCGAPCTCPQHPGEHPSLPAAHVEQARQIARELLQYALTAQPMPPFLLHRIDSDPTLFWLRGEPQPSQ